MMDLQKQIALIKAQKPVEKLAYEDLVTVFERASYMFRKYIGPLSEPSALQKNLPKMMSLCRLENDSKIVATLLAARAVAQLDSSVKPGKHNDLMLAAALDVTETSEVSFDTAGKTSVLIDPENPEDGGFCLNFQGHNIHIYGGAMDGHFKTNDISEACQQIDRLNVRKKGTSRYIEVDYRPADIDNEIEIFDTVHDPWRPSTIFSDKLKPHPTQIIEPSTLAATPYPDPIYKPLLPAETIERGYISDAQFECITYCLQAVTTFLPGSPLGTRGPKMKGGFIIGDGTGVGKSNEFCGVIMDQWLRGKKRHIVVVERSKHVPHIKEAWEMVGGNSRVIHFQGDQHASDELPSRDGIMVTTYALIRDIKRFNALVEWANENEVMDGILVFDEAHNMRNAIEDMHEEGSGRKNQSQQGMAGVNLQNELPRAGVVYASATMATDVYNLGYATRLGLWGENAPFYSNQTFIDEMYNLDEAALEQVCIDLKSAGRYCSRTLSFDGVEYEEIEHFLTPKQKEQFDKTVRVTRKLSQIRDAAMKVCTSNKYQTVGNKNDFVNIQRETIETLLTSFGMDSCIEAIHEDIANGLSPVIQISMTGEARTKRVFGKNTYLEAENYKEDRLKGSILNSFPIHKMVKVKEKWVKQVDANNQPIVIPEAVRLRDQALELSDTISIGMNALDRLYLEFGPNMVAEMTGRSIRPLPVIEKGEIKGWKAEERSNGSAVADVKAFYEGKKSILVFSLGAGGTGLSYHSSPEYKNNSRRVHYILEIGRRAETAVQGIGRTHRSGQIVPPIVRMVKCDIPAHAIYTSKTLAKIQRMGALSRGHQHATTNAIFEQRIPLHTEYAKKGWQNFVADVEQEKYDNITKNQLAEDFNLEPKDVGDLSRVLMRLPILTDGEQRFIVEQLREYTENAIAAALRNGSYNQGMETIRAESIEIIDQNEIKNSNGSRSQYYRLERHDKIDKTPFRQAMTLFAASKRRKNIKAVFMRHKVNGKVVLGIANDNGTMVEITSPSGTISRRAEAVRSEPWKLLADHEEAKRLWELEYENMDLKETSELHMLSGSLLYNWDKLPKGGIGLTRCKVKSGEVIVGRLIPKTVVKSTLQSLGMKSNFAPTQIAAMLQKVDAGAVIDLDEGWSIDLPKGENDYRLNVPDAEQTGPMKAMIKSLGVNEVITPLGSEFSIKRSDAITIIQKLAIGSDLSLSGVINPKAVNSNNVSMAAMVQY